MIHEGEMQKEINVSQNLQKVVLWVWTPLPQTSTVYIFLDIEHWTQSLRPKKRAIT